MAFHMNGYSNFHELNIDWFLKKFAEFYSEYAQFKIDWANLQNDWEAQQQAFQALQQFVTNYFDNLDVQQEINNKLNEMYEDGSLWDLMKPYIDEQLADFRIFVTPQMFGAVGDGVTDDSDAFIDALAASPVVLVPDGDYYITKQIEITNTHKLLGFGTCRIYTNVPDDYAFYIHGNEESDYEQTNYYYDNYKGVWFGGSDGGITIINRGNLGENKNGVLFGTVNEPVDGVQGANSIGKISNVGIQKYDVGIKINNYNNYLNTFERLHFERCGTCIKFGDGETVKTNSGENFEFINCVLSTSDIAVEYITNGWETIFNGCSIDFCRIAFKDSDYNRVFFSNGHIEGVGKRSETDTVYGIVVNGHEFSYFSFDRVTFDVSLTHGTKLFYGDAYLNFGTTYMSFAGRYPDGYENVFLSDKYIEKNSRMPGSARWRVLLSAANNLIPDPLLTGASIGTVSGNTVTDQIAISYKTGCDAEIVNGTMYANQKVIRFNGNGNAPMNATVQAKIPVTPLKTYNIAMATYKHTVQNMLRSVRAYFYDDNDNLLEQTSSYLYTPDQPENDTLFFPFLSRQVIAPAGAAYAKIAYVVAVSPDASALATGEYIELDYMYCEEW